MTNGQANGGSPFGEVDMKQEDLEVSFLSRSERPSLPELALAVILNHYIMKNAIFSFYIS